MIRVVLAVAIALSVAASQDANADILFTVSPGTSTVTAGSTGTLAFGVAATGADTSQEVDSYRIGFTPTAFGGADIADLSFSTPVAVGNITSGFTANTGGAGLDPGSFFVFASLDGGAQPPSIGAQLDFFTIDYAIAGNAGSSGGFNFDVKNIANGNAAADVLISKDGSRISTASIGSVEGTLVFAAVPEPSSLALAVLALGGLAMRRRRG